MEKLMLLCVISLLSRMILSLQTIRRLYFLNPPVLYYKPYVR